MPSVFSKCVCRQSTVNGFGRRSSAKECYQSSASECAVGLQREYVSSVFSKCISRRSSVKECYQSSMSVCVVGLPQMNESSVFSERVSSVFSE